MESELVVYEVGVGDEEGWGYQPKGRSTVWAVALVAAIVCLGTAQTAPPAPPTTPLAERVKAFWDARLQGDEVSAYQYITYARTGTLTVTQYVQARSPTLKYMAYTIDAIQEQENQAEVTVRLQYRLDVPGMVDSPMAMAIKEQWVRLDDGQWYREIKSKKPRKTAAQKG